MHTTCKKCGGALKRGQAMKQTYTSYPDFPGDTGKEAGCTISPGGPGTLQDCLKCEDCGWSMTVPEEVKLPLKDAVLTTPPCIKCGKPGPVFCIKRMDWFCQPCLDKANLIMKLCDEVEHELKNKTGHKH